MKKTAYLLSTAILIGISCGSTAVHATLLDNIKTIGSSIKNSQFGQSQTGQALIGTAGALGTAASNLGKAYVNQKIGILGTAATSSINVARTNAVTLQNDLNTQIQLIDQNLQTVTDATQRATLINTRQKYAQALAPLSQLTAELSTNVTTYADAKAVLSTAPGLAQQTAAALAGTAYAGASNNLLLSVNNADSSLASNITSAGTGWANQMNAQAAQYNTATPTSGMTATYPYGATTPATAPLPATQYAPAATAMDRR